MLTPHRFSLWPFSPYHIYLCHIHPPTTPTHYHIHPPYHVHSLPYLFPPPHSLPTIFTPSTNTFSPPNPIYSTNHSALYTLQLKIFSVNYIVLEQNNTFWECKKQTAVTVNGSSDRDRIIWTSAFCSKSYELYGMSYLIFDQMYLLFSL